MDLNTHSIGRPAGPGTEGTDRLAGLVAAVDALATEDLGGLAETALAGELLELQRLLNRLEGQWLRRLAAVDARGAAGADQGEPTASTASWLRRRLRMGAGAARGAVRAARTLFGGSLPETAAALVAGDISVAHARVVADGTHQLPEHVKLEADPVLVATATRLDPPRLRQFVEHLCQVADPEGADRQAERRHGRRGVWLSPTFDGMVAIDGLLEPEAGTTVLAALEPLARPAGAHDGRSGGQRTADALTELARRALEGGGLPKAGGVRPQLLVTVDLDSLLGRPGGLGGEAGWVGPLEPEACRRLACDGTVTRVIVSRQLSGPGLGDEEAGANGDLHGVAGWGRGCGPPRPSSLRPWVGRPASLWRWAVPPGWCSRPSGPPWRSATAAVSSPVVIGRWPGATPIISTTGWMVARPTWPTWPFSAGPITGRSMRAAGS